MILDCVLQNNPLPPAFNSGLLVATKQNLRWPPGAYGDLKARLRRQDGSPVVLTGGILRLAIREVTNVTTVAALVRDATITNEAQGLAVFQLASGDTSAFVEGRRYYYDVWWLDASGRRYQVVPQSEWVAAPVVLEPGDVATLGPALPPGEFVPPIEPELDPLAAIAAAGATGSLLRCIVEDHSVPPPFNSGLLVPARQPLRWPRGAYGELAAQVQRRNGSPVVLTDGILRLAIRSVTNVAIPPLLIRDAITTNAGQGLAYFVIVTADTLGFAQGQKYYYDVWWLDPSGERYQVVPISEWVAAPTVLQPADAADIPGATVPLPMWVQSISQGPGIAVNNADPRNPVVSATNAALVVGIDPGSGISVDSSNPARPIVSATTTGIVGTVGPGAGIAVDASDPVHPQVSLVRPLAADGLIEAAGPTALAMGAVANGQLLQRAGNTVAGFSLPALFQGVAPGAGIFVDAADPLNPIVSATTSGVVADVTGTEGIAINAIDPVHLIAALAWGNVGNGELLRKVGNALAGYPIIADWALTGMRFFACDFINGSDSNLGYSDLDAPAAGVVAVKTIEKMLSLIPRFGAGRSWVALVRNPNTTALTYYRPGSATVVDSVDLRPFRDYRYYNVRTTRDFAGTIADKELLAPEIVLQGPNSDGSFTVAAGGTTSGCSISAGSLTALPGIAGYRVRFKGVVTTGLAGISRNIAYNTSSAIQFGETTSLVPAEGEQFFIERPGVIIDNFFSGVGMSGGGGTGFTSSFQAHIAGFRCLQTTLATGFINGSDLTINLAFMEFHNRFSVGVVESVRVAHDYYDELGLSRVAGMGMRVTCNASPNMLIGLSSAQFNITHSALLKGTTTTSIGITRCMGSAVIGAGCYINISLSPLAGTGVITFGNNGITQIRRAYFDGANVRLSTGVMWCNVRGSDFNNLGATAMVLINAVQNGMLLLIDDCLSSQGGNTGVVVSMAANGFYGRIMFGLQVANNLAWAGSDFLTVDGTITQATINASQVIDSRQNTFLGAATGSRLRRITAGVDFNSPVLTADPVSPIDGDEWTTNIGGVRSKCKRIGGVTYRAVLT